jgi:2-(3-amino-3-carboxypropyl)histidine synthase
MEEDRAATNLGPDVSESLEIEVTSAPKQPKRRFVGRRAAEKAATTNAPNGSIEESTTIQGVKSPQPFPLHLR